MTTILDQFLPKKTKKWSLSFDFLQFIGDVQFWSGFSIPRIHDSWFRRKDANKDILDTQMCYNVFMSMTAPPKIAAELKWLQPGSLHGHEFLHFLTLGVRLSIHASLLMIYISYHLILSFCS